MSDFDRFFAEKLDEEGEFPRRDRNWKQLSQRLDAFEAGELQKPPTRWHYWPAAAAVLVSLTVAGWLLFKMQTLQQENTALRQEIADLRKAAPAAPPAMTEPGEKNTGAIKTEEQGAMTGSTPVAPASATNTAPPVTQPLSEKMAFPSAQKRAFAKKQLEKHTQPKITTPLISTQPIAFDKNLNPTSAPASNLAQQPTPAPEMVVADSLQQKPVLSGEVMAAALPADSSQQLVTIPIQDSVQVVVAEKEPEKALTPSVLPDTAATVAVAAPLIKPLRSSAHFRVGVEMVGGLPLPQPAGVSLIKGSGFTASYSPLPAFRAFATADWVHFEVNTDRYVPKFHKPREQPPMHPGPHDQLVQVESSQRQQHYALGIAYTPPLKGWLRPAVRLAHTWVHVNPSLVNFRFEDHGPGPGPGPHDSKYVAEKFGSQTISNIWRIGLGLEHERPRWTFGLWADYTKDLASTEATFDALLLRAGLQYKFD